MAELNTKLHCKKNGITEEITAYTTLDEVQNTGIQLTIGGVDAYAKYGAVGDENASQLNCKVPNDNNVYRIHKTAIPPVTVTLVCVDVQTNEQISSVRYPCVGELYLNNDNAPSVEGYDFVQLDGIRHTDVAEDDMFVVYYIANTVPDRTKTNWSAYYTQQSVTTIENPNTYTATNMTQMFYFCTKLTEIPKMNTSNVTNMNQMFTGVYLVTEYPKLDTSKVTDMSFLHFYCNSLVVAPSWDTRSVVSMNHMFYGCKMLTTVPMMDTSKVTNMASMFYECVSLTTVSTLDTSKVTNMADMFKGCSSLVTVPAMNTSRVTSMTNMFNGCVSLANVPAMNTSKATNMSQMFNGCSVLTTIDWEIDMSSCTNCNNMFANCPVTNVRLKNVPSSLDLSTIGTTNYTVVNYI